MARLGDTDFTEKRLISRADGELANGLGNLVNRVITLAHRLRDGRVVAPAARTRAAAGLAERIDEALADFDFRAATAAVVEVVDDANRLLDKEKPWTSSGNDLDRVLAVLVSTCRVLAEEIGVFLPHGAARLRDQLGRKANLGKRT
ncbi:hypothetical protein [Allokutzneria sp. NRRL B-24872]|uniref:hypothetical protein n=1 Tax=Allokutzneria sp. NRRL B-24872 TaxID=1137961 RepID=UPI001AEF994A|nr:hypothetical protein [Allokutzneria sp. NRRL B-24872]